MFLSRGQCHAHRPHTGHWALLCRRPLRRPLGQGQRHICAANRLGPAPRAEPIVEPHGLRANVLLLFHPPTLDANGCIAAIKVAMRCDLCRLPLCRGCPATPALAVSCRSSARTSAPKTAARRCNGATADEALVQAATQRERLYSNCPSCLSDVQQGELQRTPCIPTRLGHSLGGDPHCDTATLTYSTM